MGNCYDTLTRNLLPSAIHAIMKMISRKSLIFISFVMQKTTKMEVDIIFIILKTRKQRTQENNIMVLSFLFKRIKVHANLHLQFGARLMATAKRTRRKF